MIYLPQFFLIAIFAFIGLFSILFSKKDHKINPQDNPNTPEIIENRFGN